MLFTKFLMDECGYLPGDLRLVAHDLSAGEAQEREAKPLQDTLASAIFAGLLRCLLVKRIAIGLERNQRVLHADVGGKDREVHVPDAGDAQLRHQDEQVAPLLQQLRFGSEIRGRIKPAAPVGIEVRQFMEKRLAKNELDGAFVIDQRPQFAGYRIGGVLGRNTSHKHSPNWGPTNRVRIALDNTRRLASYTAGHTLRLARKRGAEKFPRCDVTPEGGWFQGWSRPTAFRKNIDFIGAP